ncbi:MAG: hypothetical protein CYG59_12155 [Chloroflexi bacterium]|nr:MAG: hypothetical protein CYG59_12155 [Chloroflexota bacterium]
MAEAIHNQPVVVVRPRLQLRAQRWLAVAIVALHVVLALWWGTVVPLGEGPDEPGHFRYALFLAREGRLPMQQADGSAGDVPGEGHQPPLAYWLMQPAVRWLPPAERVLELGADPSFIHSGGEQPNAYFRMSNDIWPYRGIALSWHLARALSAILGGVTVGLTYLLARQCFGEEPGRQWVALGAAALVALTPQFIFGSALVSNDPLLVALATGLLWSCVAIVLEKHSQRWVLVAGLLLGLLLITKQSALALVPLPCLALALRGDPKRAVGDGLMIGGLAVVLSGWWYLRNLHLYGDWLGLAAFQETFATKDFHPTSGRDWTNGLWNLLRSSWGNFGWQTLPLNDGAYWAFTAFLALGLIGLVASFGRGWWRARGKLALLLSAAIALVFAWTVAFALIAGTVAWQGRFLFPAVAAFAVLLACGLALVLPARSGLLSLIGLLLVLALALPWGLIRPAYHSYVLPPQPADFGNVYGRFDIGWKQGLELRNVEFPREVSRGGTATITLTWHAREQQDRPWSVFVHLVDAQEQIVDEANAQPQGGVFPTNSWVRGDWVRDTQKLALHHAPPGEYLLWIGLWDPATGARLGVYDQAGTLVGDRVEVGPLVVKD